jgi:hypothetical protein
VCPIKLEDRTEGWIAGLQLAAISMRGHKDTTSFIEAFTGSHHFVLDYLVEEVLQQQSESVQTFLLRSSTTWRTIRRPNSEARSPRLGRSCPTAARSRIVGSPAGRRVISAHVLSRFVSQTLRPFLVSPKLEDLIFLKELIQTCHSWRFTVVNSNPVGQ